MPRGRKFCPHCGERLTPLPKMSALEFKAARGKIGQRLGRGEPITQRQMAEMLGVSVGTVGGYERAEFDVSESVRKKVLRLLKTPRHRLRVPVLVRRKRALRRNRKEGFGAPPDAPPAAGEGAKKVRKRLKRKAAEEAVGYAGEKLAKQIRRLQRQERKERRAARRQERLRRAQDVPEGKQDS